MFRFVLISAVPLATTTEKMIYTLTKTKVKNFQRFMTTAHFLHTFAKKMMIQK